MTLALTIFIIIGSVIIVGLFAFLLVLFFREEEEKTLSPLIINLMPQYTIPVKGHAVGVEVNTTKVDNRFLIEYQPRDLNYENINDKKNIENVKVVIDKNKILTLPIGTLSSFRDVKILLAPNAEDYSSELKDTVFGKVIMAMTEAIGVENKETDIVREGSNRKSKLLEKLGDGEISEEYIDKIGEITREALKHAGDTKKESPQRSGFNPPSMP